MRATLIFAAIMIAVTGCMAVDESKPPEPGAIKIPGHPYWTVPDCKRTQPFGRWDNSCDVPYLGLPRGFANSDFSIGGPSVSIPSGVR